MLVGPGNATARPNLGLMLSHSGLREPVSQNLSWWRYEHGAIEWFNQMGTCMGERKNGGGGREREKDRERQRAAIACGFPRQLQSVVKRNQPLYHAHSCGPPLSTGPSPEIRRRSEMKALVPSMRWASSSKATCGHGHAEVAQNGTEWWETSQQDDFALI